MRTGRVEDEPQPRLEIGGLQQFTLRLVGQVGRPPREVGQLGGIGDLLHRVDDLPRVAPLQDRDDDLLVVLERQRADVLGDSGVVDGLCLDPQCGAPGPGTPEPSLALRPARRTAADSPAGQPSDLLDGRDDAVRRVTVGRDRGASSSCPSEPASAASMIGRVSASSSTGTTMPGRTTRSGSDRMGRVITSIMGVPRFLESYRLNYGLVATVPGQGLPLSAVSERAVCLAAGMFDELPVTAISGYPDAGITADRWPGDIPAVAQLLAQRWELGPVTVLVGENGSGKSTLVEAIAQAYGLSGEGGSTGARVRTRPSESGLNRALQLNRGIGAARWGFFLRAETMHGYYTYREQHPAGTWSEGGERIVREHLHEMSHGESFLDVLANQFADPGFYVLDEPESALSFTGCLALVRLLNEIAGDGRRQALVATHSPIIAAAPGARILEVDEWGLRECVWDELELVRNWRGFLENPALFLRYVIDR